MGLLARLVRHDLINATFAGRSLVSRLRQAAGSDREVAGFEMLIAWLEELQSTLEPLVEREAAAPEPADLAAWWRGPGQFVARMLPFGSETGGSVPAGEFLMDTRRLTRALTLLVLRARPVGSPCSLRVEVQDAVHRGEGRLYLRLMGGELAGGAGELERQLFAGAAAVAPEAVEMVVNEEERLVSVSMPIRPASNGAEDAADAAEKAHEAPRERA